MTPAPTRRAYRWSRRPGFGALRGGAVVAFLVFALLNPHPEAQARDAGPVWTRHASMARARTEAAFAKAGRLFYVIGGLSPEVMNTTSVEVYEARRDEWHDGPSLPLALNHAMATASDGHVYVAGGYLAVVLGATNTFFVLSEGEWRALPAMPETRAAGAMVATRGKIYVVGGFTQQGVMATTTLVYDITDREWSSAPGLPQPREHVSAVAFDRDVVVIGGRSSAPTVNSRQVERFDTTKGRWTKMPALLEPRSGHACAPVTERFIGCVGGEGPSGAISTAEMFDAVAQRWTPLPAVSPGRTGLGAAGFGSRLYTFFGASSAGYLDVAESIDLKGLCSRPDVRLLVQAGC